MGYPSNEMCSIPDPCGGPQNEFSPQFCSSEELERIPQLPPRPKPPQPRCMTIQQPPRLACKKRIVFINKTIPEPVVVNRCKQVMIPKVVEIVKVVQVPKLEWIPQLTVEKKVVNYTTMQSDPSIVSQSRTIYEPREICQMVICQPKPQVIEIPTPTEYCCYPTGSTKYQPNLCSSNSGQGCNFYGPLQCSPGYCPSSCQEPNLKPAVRSSVGNSFFLRNLPMTPYIPGANLTTDCGSSATSLRSGSFQYEGRNCMPYPRPFTACPSMARCSAC